MTHRHVRKALAVVVLTLSGAVAQGLVVGAAAAWVTLIIGALSTAGVYALPNEPEPLSDEGLTAIEAVIIATFVLVALLALDILPT